MRRPGRLGNYSTIMAIGIVGFLMSGSSVVNASMQYGDLQLSGNVESLNLVRTPEFGEFEFIQNRNTLRARVDWEWLKDGKFVDRWNVPFLKESKFYLLYRGVYDGFYDIAPGGNQTGQSRADDRIGGPIDGNGAGTCVGANGMIEEYDPETRTGCGEGTSLRPGLYSRFDHDDRRSERFENIVREVFIDFTLRDAPITFRMGRQQVIWGEADQFRLMDIWNPLDVSWRFPVADTFDNFRTPLWLMKAIWDTGQLGPLRNTFVEVVYNPFDFQPGQKVEWLPHPWSLPFADPTRAGQVQYAKQGPLDLLITPRFELGGTSFKRGDFERNPKEASEAGARFHFVTDSGIESTINYVYGRGKWVGTSPAFGVDIKSIVAPNISQSVGTFAGYPVSQAIVNAEIVHPYVHVFGITGNYFDDSFTSSVLRMEMAYAMGEPYPTSQEDKLVTVTNPNGTPVNLLGCPVALDPRCVQKSPVGFTKRDVFAGMIGFDRPTWIRFLNNKQTFFISGQFFWTHIPGHNVNHLRGFQSALRDPYFTPALDGLDQSGGFGQWQTGPFTGLTERTQNGNTTFEIEGTGDDRKVVNLRREGAPSDNVKPWEFMMTLTLQTFYRGGTIVPQFVTLFDPINLWVSPFFQLEFHITNDLILTLQERIFVPMRSPTNDPWFVGRFGRRSETGLMMTYQF